MGIVSRPNTFVDGTTAAASEVNADLDTLYTLVNGNIDNANIKDGAAIDPDKLAEVPQTKVGDYAADITEYGDTTTPGDTGTPSLPTSLQEELERLRYRIGANRSFLANTSYMNSSAAVTAAAWFEPGIVGRNLVPNPGFETHSAGTPNAPDKWTLLGTPSVVAIENPAHPDAGLEKRSLNIVTDASAEGVSVTVAGLKASTKYLVGMAYSLTTGQVNLNTSNGLASGAYQNLLLPDSSAAASSVEVLNGIVKTTSTPAPITIAIFGSATGADFNIHYVWMYEMTEAYPAELPSIPVQTALYTTADDTVNNTGAGAWSNRADLSLSQYVPAPGYRLKYEVTLCFRSPTVGSRAEHEYAFRLQQNIDAGGATTVEGPYAWRMNTSSNDFDGGTMSLSYVLDNPTPGSTYAMTTDVWTKGNGTDDSDDIIFNPTLGTAGDTLATQSRARLVMERL